MNKIAHDERTIFHTDALGSTRATTDEDRTVLTTAIYDAYGNIQSNFDPQEEFAFAGEYGYYKDNTGLTYIKHRYYDSEIGRFISRDPIGYLGGFNLYSYVKNNPVRYVDPEGFNPVATGRAIGTIMCLIRVYTGARKIYNGIDVNGKATLQPNDKAAHCYMACEAVKSCGINALYMIYIMDLAELHPANSFEIDDMRANFRGGYGGSVPDLCDGGCEKYCRGATMDLIGE